MSRENYFTNADGLVIGFGTRTTEKNSGTALNVSGARQQVVVQIQGGSEIKDTDVSAQLIYGVTIPANALLESARLFVTTAFTSGGSATLDIGTFNAASGVAVNAAGIASAVAVATLVDNYTALLAGAQVGTVLTTAVKIGVTYNTATFTAGEAFLIVEYIPDQISSS